MLFCGIEVIFLEHRQLELFQQAVTACNVNSIVIFKDWSNLSKVDNAFRLHLYENYDYKPLQNFFDKQAHSCIMVHYEDEFEMLYIFLSIPREYLHDYESSFLTIGPYLADMPDSAHISQIMNRRKIPETLLGDIQLVYASTPILPDVPSFESLVLNLVQGLFHTDYQELYLPDQNENVMEHSPLLLKLKKNPDISTATIEERYEMENKMLEAVSSGDSHKAQEAYQKFQTYQLRPRTENALQNEQHGIIILNTLFRKAVEQAGVPPLYIDDLSGKFAVLIHEARTVKEVARLSGDMIHKYCLLVQNHAMPGYSKATKDVISYIDFHYAEDLTLSFFAKMFSLNKNYLSALFKKESGITLTEYIHQVRIRRAITMINLSPLSITTIASSCGYNDVNYFIRVFKREMGVSPKQYQKAVLHGGTPAP